MLIHLHRSHATTGTHGEWKREEETTDWVEHLITERPLHLHVVIYLLFSGGSVFHFFTYTGREETHGHINATHWAAKHLKNDPAAKHTSCIGNSRRPTKRLTDFNKHLKVKSTIFKFKSRHFDVIIKGWRSRIEVYNLSSCIGCIMTVCNTLLSNIYSTSFIC